MPKETLPLVDPETDEVIEPDPQDAEAERTANRLASIPAFLKAMKGLCPTEGDGGLASVTISAGGRSVTLTGNTRRKIDRMLKNNK